LAFGGTNRVTVDRARARWLGVAAATGLASAAWAAFQWYQLVVSRRGGEVVCFGGGGQCAEVWDSPFATAVHTTTGLPVAGWGTVFGLVAFALPLVARVRLARRRTAESWLAATWVAAVAGLLGVGLLLAASLRFGHVCTTCVLTYVLTAAYGAAVFAGVRVGPPPGLLRGAPLAAGAVALGFVLLIHPGLRTPQNATSAGARAVERSAPLAPQHSDADELARFIAGLPADGRQLLSDTLAAYAAEPEIEPPRARAVIGPPNARLHITEFFDTLCGHCAQFHELLVQLRQRLGPDAFALAAHQFPLDRSCNPNLSGDHSDPLHCTAARAHICVEGKAGAFDFAKELFAQQRSLSEAAILAAGEKIVPREDLVACMSSPETAAKLASDVAWATSQGVRGTPFVLINKRKALPFPPLIYALALARGAAAHPAFAALPPAQPLPAALR
jgi:protein-disulfide isomerase/uncharacterized membrane protein